MPTDYLTEDIGLSAYLLLIAEDIQEIRSNGSQFAQFIFKDSPALRLAVRNYFSRRASVEPVAYMETVRSLKNASRRGAVLRDERKGDRVNAVPPR